MIKLNTHRTKYKASNKGFSLIEVLIAMLILAIGFMGIAALQFKGLKYNTDALFRSQISVLAYDITDRIRLNSANAAAYVSTYTISTTDPGCTQATATAANDLNCWHQQGFNALPPGANNTMVITAVGSIYTVALSWTDREGDSHSISYTFQP